MPPFFLDEEYRAAFLANIAGRLRETINDDCKVCLQQRNIKTPITDVSLLLFIAKHPGCSIADIAKGVDHSHQRTAARMSALLKLSLVEKQVSAEDARCTSFYLTELGLHDAQALKTVYESAAVELEALFNELGCNLLQESMRAIESLKRNPLSERIEARVGSSN